MRFVLERALFAPHSPEEAKDLLRLLLLNESQRHAIMINPPYEPDADNGPLDAWLAARSHHEAAAMRSLLAAGLLQSAARPAAGGCLTDTAQPPRWQLDGPLLIRVERRTESDWQARRLTLRDAAALLREPCHLVVENAQSDRDFVRWLAGPSDGSVIEQAFAEPGRIAVHDGGSGIKNWLAALAEQDPPTAEGYRRLLRTWVLFDKDAGEADARALSKAAQNILNICSGLVGKYGPGLSFACLLRREWESYVPDSGLMQESMGNQKAFVQQIIAWRAAVTQQDFAWAVDLKNGLHGDLRQDLSESERAPLKAQHAVPTPNQLRQPFCTLSQQDVQTLSRGLGEKRLSRALQGAPQPDWRFDLAAEYDRGPADQAPRLSLLGALMDRI